MSLLKDLPHVPSTVVAAAGGAICAVMAINMLQGHCPIGLPKKGCGCDCWKACGTDCKANPKKEDPKESKQIYETKQSVNQYLEFHFVAGKDSFEMSAQAPDISVAAAYDFPARLATIAAKHARSDRRRNVLDIGCAVGRTTFELTKTFDQATGIDLSSAFIEAAEMIKVKGQLAFDGPGQGQIPVLRVAKLPAGVDAQKARFAVGDALNIDVDGLGGPFDCVIGANLLCRLPDPMHLLKSFDRVVNRGGIVVLASPYSWWAGATDPSSWIGGTPAKGASEPLIKAQMTSQGYELLEEGVAPFLIRDHPRRYQLGFSHLTVWRRK